MTQSPLRKIQNVQFATYHLQDIVILSCTSKQNMSIVDTNMFECFECGKQFMLKWRLEKHKRMHTSRPIKVCRYFSAKEVCPFEKYGCKFRHSAHSSQNENTNSFVEFSRNFQTSTPEKKVGTRYTCSKSKCSENNQCTHCFVKQLYMDGEVNLDDASSVEFSFV